MIPYIKSQKVFFKRTKEEQLIYEIGKIKDCINTIKYRGAVWTFNLATGEGECKTKKLSKGEELELNKLELELKKLEVELKKLSIEKDF